MALWLRGIPLSISASVGFIALSGVTVLTGLAMIAAIRCAKTACNRTARSTRLSLTPQAIGAALDSGSGA